MSLPAAWIDKIFERLSIRYGRDFLNRWEGMPITDVKTDWGNVLEGFEAHPDSIRWALENLPDSKAPTAQDFRAICRRAPTPDMPRLEAPKADMARVNAELAKLHSTAAPKFDPKDWARRILAEVDAGYKVSPIRIRFAKEALA